MPLKWAEASATVIRPMSTMDLSARMTARDSGLSRSPSQARQAVSRRYFSYQVRMDSEPVSL